MPDSTPVVAPGNATPRYFFSVREKILSGGFVTFETVDLGEVDAVEDHLELSGSQGDTGLVCGRFGKVIASGFQPLAPQTQTMPAPIQDLESISRAIAEDEQVSG